MQVPSTSKTSTYRESNAPPESTTFEAQVEMPMQPQKQAATASNQAEARQSEAENSTSGTTPNIAPDTAPNTTPGATPLWEAFDPEEELRNFLQRAFSGQAEPIEPKHPGFAHMAFDPEEELRKFYQTNFKMNAPEINTPGANTSETNGPETNNPETTNPDTSSASPDNLEPEETYSVFRKQNTLLELGIDLEDKKWNLAKALRNINECKNFSFEAISEYENYAKTLNLPLQMIMLSPDRARNLIREKAFRDSSFLQNVASFDLKHCAFSLQYQTELQNIGSTVNPKLEAELFAEAAPGQDYPKRWSDKVEVASILGSAPLPALQDQKAAPNNTQPANLETATTQTYRSDVPAMPPETAAQAQEKGLYDPAHTYNNPLFTGHMSKDEYAKTIATAHLGVERGKMQNRAKDIGDLVITGNLKEASNGAVQYVTDSADLNKRIATDGIPGLYDWYGPMIEDITLQCTNPTLVGGLTLAGALLGGGAGGFLGRTIALSLSGAYLGNAASNVVLTFRIETGEAYADMRQITDDNGQPMSDELVRTASLLYASGVAGLEAAFALPALKGAHLVGADRALSNLGTDEAKKLLRGKIKGMLGTSSGRELLLALSKNLGKDMSTAAIMGACTQMWEVMCVYLAEEVADYSGQNTFGESKKELHTREIGETALKFIQGSVVPSTGKNILRSNLASRQAETNRKFQNERRGRQKNAQKHEANRQLSENYARINESIHKQASLTGQEKILESSLGQSITTDVYINAKTLQALKEKGFDLADPLGLEGKLLKDCAAKNLNLKLPMSKLLARLKPEEFKQLAPLMFYKDPSLPDFDYKALREKTRQIDQNYQKATTNRVAFEAGLERFGQKLNERINQDAKLFNLASEHPGGVKGYVEMQKRICRELAEYQACAGVSLQETLGQVINANSQESKARGLLDLLKPQKLFQGEKQRDDLLTGKHNFGFSKEDGNYVLHQAASEKSKNKAKLGTLTPYTPPKQTNKRKGM